MLATAVAEAEREQQLNEVICGHQRSTYFGHTRKRAIIITASDYTALRAMEGKQRYADLPDTEKDQQVMVAGLRMLGFGEEDIIAVREPSWAELHGAVMELALEVQKASMDGGRTLIFAYYAGHGLSDNLVYAQLNEERIYPLEKMLRDLAKADGSYIVCLFDCCRERMQPGAARGPGTEVSGMLDVPTSAETEENFIITYGCPPTEGVPAKSTIARAYVGYLKQAADPKGNIALPGPLNFFVGAGGKCEHSIKVRKPLLLQWMKQSTASANMTKKISEDLKQFSQGLKLEKVASVQEAKECLSPELKQQAADGGVDIDSAVREAYFEPEEEFYDFHQPMKKPETVLEFNQNYRPLTIEFSHQKHLLVEGNMMDMNVGVYQIGKTDSGKAVTDPIKVIDTGSRGLSAVVMGKEKIYMGFFMGNDESANLQVHVYSLNYELVHRIVLDMEENMIYGMTLAHDEQYLICVHQQGLVTIINTHDYSFRHEQPFGEIENIWEVTTAHAGQGQNTADTERLVFVTSNGCFTTMLSNDGLIQVEKAYLEGSNVTNVALLKDDTVFLTTNDEEGISKFYTIDTNSEAVECVIDQNDVFDSFDMDKVPRTDDTSNYFILHQQGGLHLVDPQRKKLYTLSHDRKFGITTCRSIAITQIDDTDPTRGFWLAWIDNSQNFSTEIKIYEFDDKFVAEMEKLSKKIQE